MPPQSVPIGQYRVVKILVCIPPHAASLRRDELQPASPFDQGRDHLGQEPPGDAIGPLSCGGDGGVAGLEPIAELGCPDPGVTVRRPWARTAPRNSRASRGGGPAVECRGESGEPLARASIRCEDVMAGSVRDDRLAW
ncbi:hypothetical protein [Singulisphaera acidiphila]|uniref:hypothetical protein n=1 Tax=Singulisphaera acidiphila TaxID=466153 RepID=UPI0003803EFB|nr:hypothetical protein [Singulisphaera acidiphila]